MSKVRLIPGLVIRVDVVSLPELGKGDLTYMKLEKFRDKAWAQWQTQPLDPPKDTFPDMNTWPPKSQTTKSHPSKESYHALQHQLIKYECLHLEEKLEEVLPDKREDEGHKDSPQYSFIQQMDLQEGDKIILVSLMENKWTQAHLMYSSDD